MSKDFHNKAGYNYKLPSLFLGKPGNVNGTAKPYNYENYPTEGQSLGLDLVKESVCPGHS